MKRLLPVTLIVALFILSCSTYTTESITRKGDLLKSITNAGLILRISKNSKIEKEDYIRSASQWLGALTTVRGLILLTQASDAVSTYTSEAERFYQISGNGEFQKFKSSGVINMYVRGNEAELKKIMEEKKLDGMVFYEIYSISSMEMQFIDFDSTVCVLDKNLQVAYTDRQADKFEIDEMNSETIKNRLLDKISERLVETLVGLKFVTK
ncbi:MAG: hypothetical protein EPN93_15865 [Spirochaetes bacterium]|nr:MAG: hypothetical protein EPN93_15865 [Spirochaetota bacterium]